MISSEKYFSVSTDIDQSLFKLMRIMSDEYQQKPHSVDFWRIGCEIVLTLSRRIQFSTDRSGRSHFTRISLGEKAPQLPITTLLTK